MLLRHVRYDGSEAATLVLNVRAPVGGARFDVWSTNPKVATVPESVTIPDGEQTAQLSIAWQAVGTTEVRARLVSVGGVDVVGALVHVLSIMCLPGQVVTVEELAAAAEISELTVLVEAGSDADVSAVVAEATTATADIIDVSVVADLQLPLAEARICED